MPGGGRGDWEEFEEDIFGSRVCGEMPVHVICEGRVGHSHIGAGNTCIKSFLENSMSCRFLHSNRTRD